MNIPDQSENSRSESKSKDLSQNNDKKYKPKVSQTNLIAIGRLLTRAIEFIGAHPLSTGLLAILGVLGFMISVAGFRLDRNESSQTSVQISELRQEIEKSPADRYPTFGHVYLDSDELTGTFLQFLGENENGIVRLKIAFPKTENTGHSGINENYLFYRQKEMFGEGEFDFTCQYLYFVNDKNLTEYLNWDSGYWHLNGFFEIGSIQTRISDPDCMVFERRIKPIPLTNEGTSIL